MGCQGGEVMRFSLTFSMDNSAFDVGGDNNADEVVRILHTVADQIDAEGALGNPFGRVRDLNGNTIGRWGVTDTDNE